jgi:hypothetical protein
MNRFHLRSISLALAAVCALVAAGTGAASPAGSAPSTLSLLSVQTSFVPVPAISKASPPQIGGRMFFENTLYNRAAQFGRPNGARVGSAEVLCTIVSRQAMECVVTAHLPGGELILTGSNPLGSHHTAYAVTGGIGIFSAVRGSAHGIDLSGTKTVVVGSLIS